MRKQIVIEKLIKKTIAYIFILFISTIFFIPQAHAQLEIPSGEEICEWVDDTNNGWLGRIALMGASIGCGAREVYQTVSNVSTTVDMFENYGIFAPLFLIFNRNPDQMSMCGMYWIGYTLTQGTWGAGDCSTVPGLGLYPAIESLLLASGGDTTNYENVMRTSCEYAATGACEYCTLFGMGMSNPTGGSLWGITNIALNSVVTEAPPISLAYFAKHTAQKIPVLNRTAFAQTQYNMSWGLEIIIGLWEKMRDIALAMMSIMMLILGFLIITRRKLNAQTTVTVQYAIPRVIISLFLIVFSYPIGAFFANAIIPLCALAIRMLIDASKLQEFICNIPRVLIMLFPLMAGMWGLAMMSMVMIIFMVVGLIISIFAILIKLIIIQAKILIAIITAPVIFALGALPGQDDLIKNWFKQMAARVIAVPAMIFVLFLGILLYVQPFMDVQVLSAMLARQTMQQPSFVEIGFSVMGKTSNFITLVMLPIISTVIIFSAIGIEKKVNEMIMGPKGKR